MIGPLAHALDTHTRSLPLQPPPAGHNFNTLPDIHTIPQITQTHTYTFVLHFNTLQTAQSPNRRTHLSSPYLPHSLIFPTVTLIPMTCSLSSHYTMGQNVLAMDFTSRRTDSRDSGRVAWGARQRWARVRRAAVHSTGQSPARRSGVKSGGVGVVGVGAGGDEK